MELGLKPFIQSEYRRKYVLTHFVEGGLPFAFLRRQSQSRINSGNKYKFGLIDRDGKYHWFFYGRAVCRDRQKAITLYNHLLKYCKDEEVGQPFAFKE